MAILIHREDTVLARKQTCKSIRIVFSLGGPYKCRGTGRREKPGVAVGPMMWAGS